MTATAPVVQATGLAVSFPGRRRLLARHPPAAIQAVSGVSLEVSRGETLAVVGESGCGKSTLGRALLRTVPLDAGRILFEGRDVTALGGEALRRARLGFQMIFQDPYASLNPKMRIADALAEPLRVHTSLSVAAVRERVAEILAAVGLGAEHGGRFPHEFSGGQRQRIAIARAVVLRPSFIVADEPLSALDVSLQLQILKLFDALRQRYALTYLFISHDLARVFGFADRVAVMYLGRIVEIGPAADLIRAPAHPYTQALIDAAPEPDPRREAARIIVPLSGEVPSPANPPPGCRFHTRCPRVMAICRAVEPPLVPIGTHHLAACHLATPTDPGRPG